MKSEKLFDIGYVTDHDTGDYHIGEIDWRIHQVILREYLYKFGVIGKKDIINSLSTLMYIVESEFRSTNPNEMLGDKENG